ncbi:hypothetical protein N657DRAFT_647453 [Parathielavia appendiculata]|uniref:Uncharacterized protein n=1 Tax=Parathielavia appendiculata TaxID=2587402 RepID=A0AAN6TXJ6_9PEZI|nr:hypothetical protein N657DRAFT_647453 [Parathielavia appendiculata]
MQLTLLSFLPLVLANPLTLHERQSEPQITSMTATGDGCPSGTFSTLIGGEGNKSGKASFDVFDIIAGHDLSVSNKTLSCDVSVAVSFPGTCKQAVLKTRTDAFVLVAMAEGATARVSSQFSVLDGSGGGSPPDLVYTSQPGQNVEDDIGRNWNVSISATGAMATLVAHLEIFLDSPNAELISRVTLDGFGLLVSQEGVC